jgi:hypothetical protein
MLPESITQDCPYACSGYEVVDDHCPMPEEESGA